jgi:dihydrofolate synthase / folylpolyglutamate synthase
LPALTYAELTARLFPRLTGGIRWGLDRTRSLLAAVGDPHLSFRVVHIGGTNGKGSVAAHAESVLRRAGRRTGLYTSPHLCSFRERIRIDGEAIGEAALLAAAERLWPHIEAAGPSFFEATTAIAFLAMADAGVEAAVVEVGLGGRLDATNVVEPDVVIITNVALDHVQLLGPTLTDVAREKAGIIKAGVPVVCGESGSPAADIFSATAAERGAPLHTIGADDVFDMDTDASGTRFTMRTPTGDMRLHSPLPGLHQAANAALAVRGLLALRVGVPSPAAVQEGIATTRWPGRLQIERVAGLTWVFDVAHNAAGVEALVRALPLLAPAGVTAVVGVLGDKDWPGMLGPLCATARSVLLVDPPTAPADRRWDASAVLRSGRWPNAEVAADFAAALDLAQGRAREAGGGVLVTGSFHTVGDALAALRLAPDGADFEVPAPAFLQGVVGLHPPRGGG